MGFESRKSLAIFAARRLLKSVLLILGVIVVSFLIIHLAPGDVTIALAGTVYVPKRILDELRTSLGLDQPLYVQLGLYIARVGVGNLGYSYVSQETVASLILARLPVTLILVVSPMVIYTLLGVVLGVLASRKQYSLVDNMVSLVSSLGIAVPVFWLGQILILVFSANLGWFPVQGQVSIRTPPEGIGLYLDMIWHTILPATTVGLWQLALVSRLSRASMIESLHQDYITWARSKGATENTVTFKHALRNALLPVVTITGYNFGYLLTAATLTEIVFAWPGLGRLLVDSIYLRDFPVITGLLIFVSITVILANTVTDILYGFLDPRIRYR